MLSVPFYRYTRKTETCRTTKSTTAVSKRIEGHTLYFGVTGGFVLLL